MAQINLPQLSNWTELSESEQYWAGYLARKLSDSGRVLEWRPGGVHQVLFRYSEEEDGPPISELWALDALLCALTHAESKYAFRALLQARGYISAEKFHYLSDCYRMAKARVEKVLGF